MSKEWTDLDRNIGEWLDANGVYEFEQCPFVKRTMIYKNDLRNNADRQEEHYCALWEIGSTDYTNVVEIGAGIGQFARKFVKTAETHGMPINYTIFDLPNVSRIQKLINSDMAMSWLSAPQPLEDGLIVSLFALSEMEYDERDKIMDAFGWHNAMFFAYQSKHEDYDNDWWFGELVKELKRPYAMSPTRDGHWYMFIEEK